MGAVREEVAAGAPKPRAGLANSGFQVSAHTIRKCSSDGERMGELVRRRAVWGRGGERGSKGSVRRWLPNPSFCSLDQNLSVWILQQVPGSSPPEQTGRQLCLYFSYSKYQEADAIAGTPRSGHSCLRDLGGCTRPCSPSPSLESHCLC